MLPMRWATSGDWSGATAGKKEAVKTFHPRAFLRTLFSYKTHLRARNDLPFGRSARPGIRIGREDDGAATAEYAIATMAAVGFAGLLVVIMRSDAVRAILTDLVHRALTFAG